MKLKNHGPLGVVTGSCYELLEEESGLRFLVDCGAQQGEPTAEDWNTGGFPFDPKSIDFVILTHAHFDHCGLIPRLYSRGFRGEVLCTKATAELAELNLRGSAKHAKLFSADEVKAIRWKIFRTLNREHSYRGLRITFRRTAHMLGAVSVRVSWGFADDHNQIIFSGDIGTNTAGNEHQSLLRHQVPPFAPRGKRSYVVMESTYGSHVRPLEESDFGTRIAALERQVVGAVVRKGGMLIIPCFAIGRTQDVLFDLQYLFATRPGLRGIPIYFDAGMARQANDIYARAVQERANGGQGEPLWLNGTMCERLGLPDTRENQQLVARVVAATLSPSEPMPDLSTSPSSILPNWSRSWEPGTRSEGKVVVPQHPCIVVTGGGMCDGGLVREYLLAKLGDETTTVLLTGHCGPQTNGGKLLALSKLSKCERAMSQEYLIWGPDRFAAKDVHAAVDRISGYSGHADQEGLLRWLFGSHRGKPYVAGTTIFLTHGSDHSRTALTEAIQRRVRQLRVGKKLRLESPSATSGWFDLDTARWVGEEVRLLDTISREFRQLATPQKEFVLEGLMKLLCFPAYRAK